MSTLKFNVGMGQMLVEGGAYEKNLERACQMVRKAKEFQCSIVVLPECLDAGWTHPESFNIAKPIPGPSSDLLCKAAKENELYVAAGLTEKDGDKIYNTAILIDSSGEIILKYRKIHILDLVQDLYSTGNSLSVVETPFGKIGVNICADNFMNSLTLAHSMARMGAEIILAPSSWTIESSNNDSEHPYGEVWLRPYKKISELYDMAIIGVTNVGVLDYGVWKGKRLPGKSLAVWSEGTQIMEGPYGDQAESLVVVPLTVNRRKITGTDITKMLEEKGYDGP